MEAGDHRLGNDQTKRLDRIDFPFVAARKAI